MEIIFLGTSCMVPTKERNHQSILLLYRGDRVLIDCGEGTQRQFKEVGRSIAKINTIFITHWHGDHVFGLPGMLQSLNASDYQQKLMIYGPEGTKKNIKNLFNTFNFVPVFDYKIMEIEKDKIELKDLIVNSAPLKHTTSCLGYSFKEKDRRKVNLDKVKKIGMEEGPLLGKLQNNEEIEWKGKKIKPEEVTYVVEGKKVSIILDTVPTKEGDNLVKGSDLLIAEAVYTEELKEKAKEYKHMTATQAAKMAAKNKVKKLVLTHFSQRYKTSEEIVKEAKEIFENTEASHDFLKIEI